MDLVFFFRQTGADAPARLLPGPGGATESELDLAAWADIAAANPVLDALEPDVEAVLLRRHDGGFSCYLVPIDVCYELVGVVRSSWTGLGGGPEVWREIEAFFGALDHRATRARRPEPGRRMTLSASDGSTAATVRRSTSTSPAWRWSPTATPRARPWSSGCGATETPGARVHAVALRCQVRIEPVRRRYSDTEAAQGRRPVRRPRPLGQTMQPMQLAFLSQVLPGFTGSCDLRPPAAAELRRRRRRPQVPRRASRTARSR